MERNLAEDEKITLLISYDFMHSGYCYDVEMDNALQQHSENKAKVISVYIGETDVHDTVNYERQGLNEDRRTIINSNDRDGGRKNVGIS
ncbi:hypothetical protein EWW49_31470 [Pseudomonas syringae]|nr:hypothetical protein EWW49_31470 [Pseudomonas syringae]